MNHPADIQCSMIQALSWHGDFMSFVCMEPHYCGVAAVENGYGGMKS